MEEDGERGPDEGFLLVRIHVPELNVQKCLQFPRDQLVWDVKQQCLAALPKVSFWILKILPLFGFWVIEDFQMGLISSTVESWIWVSVFERIENLVCFCEEEVE